MGRLPRLRIMAAMACGGTAIPAILVAGSDSNHKGVPLPVSVDFEACEAGNCQKEDLKTLFGGLSWESLNERALIVKAQSEDENAEGTFLRVFYPKGKVRSKESGAQFLIPLVPSREVTLSYRFRFAEDFDFSRGGKLPGLSSGGSLFTGRERPGAQGGWSARFMWRSLGASELYLYHREMKDDSGDHIPLKHRFRRGVWHTITQQVIMDPDDPHQGTIRVFLDGELTLEIKDLTLGGDNFGPADTFYFSTFFGGSNRNWAPGHTCHIDFDDILIQPGIVDPELPAP